MKDKIFQGSGFEGINDLEKIINDWIEKNITDNLIVKDKQTNLCQVADSPAGERSQHMVVCIWYDSKFSADE